MKQKTIEKHYSLKELASLVGYSPSALREKARRREFAYRRSGRLILVPQSQIDVILGSLMPAASKETVGVLGSARN